MFTHPGDTHLVGVELSWSPWARFVFSSKQAGLRVVCWPLHANMAGMAAVDDANRSLKGG